MKPEFARNNKVADIQVSKVSCKPTHLRQISIKSLVGMVVTALLIVLLYRHDQLTEHSEIIRNENEASASHVMHLLDDEIATLISTSKELEAQAFQENPIIENFSAALAKVSEHNILKLKLFNLSGTVAYSSAKKDIGKMSSHPDFLKKALDGTAMNHIEYRETFLVATGELHDVYIVEGYYPIIHSGQMIGVFEIYGDATPAVNRIHQNMYRISFMVLGLFVALYVAQYISAAQADKAVLQWEMQLEKANEKIQDLAFHDSLTQLANRNLIIDRLEQTIALSKRSGIYAAMLFLDLDNFKSLNDTHGHSAGDLLLIEAARRIKSCVREVDTVGRFGGDEFVVMLSELSADKNESMSQVMLVAEKIRNALSVPYLLTISTCPQTEKFIEHWCTASIGMVVFKNHETNTDDIFKMADSAMYKAKQSGPNHIRFYDADE
jgi:diguanylate cyclase (GGDEF)-like protein